MIYRVPMLFTPKNSEQVRNLSWELRFRGGKSGQPTADKWEHVSIGAGGGVSVAGL